jgi:hypothetical protein
LPRGTCGLSIALPAKQDLRAMVDEFFAFPKPRGGGRGMLFDHNVIAS